MNQKNYLRYVAWLMLLVMGGLGLLYFMPSLEIGNHTMRRVDLLADIRVPVDEAVDEPDSLLLPPVKVKPAFRDTCPQGKTCIEDYSDSTMRGMRSFYEALREVEERPVRIAYFGDSFIEADILTADLREMLQTRFGGCGVGFVPVTSTTNGFRPTVRHSFSGWSSHSVTDTVYFDHSKQGVSGHYFIPHTGATVELRGQRKYASRLDTCRQATLFFLNRGEARISVQVNKEAPESYAFESSARLQQLKVDGRIGRVKWTVEHADSTLFYGMTMDGQTGIQLDNFSLRGTSGLHLRSVPRQMMEAFNRLRPYDLIILQYGLNAATPKGRNYDKYMAGMRTSLQHVKAAFPQASILVVSVGDRDYRTETGDLRTMSGIKNMVRYQQNLAAEERVAFWNLWEAMGGEGSMATLVHATPALANHDYTHINFKGGRHLAALLYDALLYGSEQYERRKSYEAE